jgi:hypothetical protein
MPLRSGEGKVLPASYEFLMKLVLDMVCCTVGTSIVSHNDIWSSINRSCYFQELGGPVKCSFH